MLVTADNFIKDFDQDFTATVTSPEKAITSKNSNMFLQVLVSGGCVLTSPHDLNAETRSNQVDSKIEFSIENGVEQNQGIVNLAELYGDLQKFLDELNDGEVASNYSKMELIQEILSFKSLIPGWDGFGAAPLEVKAAANAIEIINYLDQGIAGRIEEIYPNPHGTISFAWQNDVGEEISVEVGNDSMTYYVDFLNQKPQFFNDIKITKKEMELLASFVEKL